MRLARAPTLVGAGTRFDRAGRRVKRDWQSHLWGVLERENKKHAEVRLALTLAFTHLRSEGGDPTRKVAMDHVTLVLPNVGEKLVLLVNADTPIIVDAQIRIEINLAIVSKERVVIDILVADTKREVPGGMKLNPVLNS